MPLCKIRWVIAYWISFSMSALGETDQHFRRFRLVRLQARRIFVGPAREIHHDGESLVALFFRLEGLDDVEAIAVEKVGVVAKQPFELRHHRMSRRNGLGIELIEGPLDLCGIHLHRTLLSM